MKMEVARGEMDLDDYDATQREIRGIIEQEKDLQLDSGSGGDERRDGQLEVVESYRFREDEYFVPSKFISPLKYLKDFERVKHDLPNKHYYLDHHSQDGLTKRINQLKKNEQIVQLEYATGFNSASHSNLIWNTRFNCMVYSFENKVILEEFGNKRKQSVLNLPEAISCMDLSSNGVDVAVASATVNHDIYAPVYILNLETSKLVKRLLLHTRGIQCVKYSPDCKFLLSLGNFKDSRMAVWNIETGSVAAKSQEVLAMHEAAWRRGAPRKGTGRRLEREFVVVGKGRLAQWRFCEEDGGLRVHAQKLFSGPAGADRDTTAVEYLRSEQLGDCIAVGLDNGLFLILKADGLQTLFEMSLFESEVSCIQYSPSADKVVVSGLDGLVLSWNFNQISPENFDPDSDLRRLKLDAGVSAMSFDAEFEEGIVSTIDGGIKYVSLLDLKHGSFIQGVDPLNPIMQMIVLGNDILLTIHRLGDGKLWSVHTGEVLKELKWKEMISYAVLVAERSQIFFFLKNYDILVMEVNNFNRVKLLKNRNSDQMSDGYMDNYIHKGIVLRMGGSSGPVVQQQQQQQQQEDQQEGDQVHTRYLFSTYKGETLVTDFRGDQSIVMNQVKFPELYANISDFDYHISDDLLMIATNKGQLLLYKSLDVSAPLEQFNFRLFEKFNAVENPHGDLDQSEEERQATEAIYSLKSHIVKGRFTRSMKSCYFYIVESLQYIYVRNFVTKEVRYFNYSVLQRY